MERFHHCLRALGHRRAGPMDSGYLRVRRHRLRRLVRLCVWRLHWTLCRSAGVRVPRARDGLPDGRCHALHLHSHPHYGAYRRADSSGLGGGLVLSQDLRRCHVPGWVGIVLYARVLYTKKFWVVF